MKASELIKQLQKIIEQEGDLEVMTVIYYLNGVPYNESIDTGNELE